MKLPLGLFTPAKCALQLHQHNRCSLKKKWVSRKGWRFLMGAKHLGNNHVCGDVSGSLSGFMPQVELGTSHSLQLQLSAMPPIQLVSETLLCMTEQNSRRGHMRNRCFVAGSLERGHHTHAIHLRRVNWCYTSVSQGKQATFSTLLSLPITWGGSKARREKLQPAEDCLAFLWKWEETEQVGIAHLSQGTDELARRCLCLVQSRLQKKPEDHPLWVLAVAQWLYKAK